MDAFVVIENKSNSNSVVESFDDLSYEDKISRAKSEL
jgi:hypothetical protein